MSNAARAIGTSDMAESEAAQHRHVQNARITADDEVANAKRFLRDSADALGKARGAVVAAEHKIKHVEALMTLASTQKSAEMRKSEARATKEWTDATDAEVVAVAEFEKLKALREAASMVIEIWRTECSNLRSLR